MQEWVREPIRLLLVDDDPEFLAVATAHLEREEGLEVMTEERAEAALQRLDPEPVDCVVSDYQMPGMDGLAFLEAVRETHPDLPFLLFTAQGSEEVASDAIRAGVDDYVLKSGNESYRVLANRVRTVVEQYRAETSYREVFEKTSIGMVVQAPDTGEVLDANQHFCEMLGYDRRSITDLSVGDFSVNEEGYTEKRSQELVDRAATEGPQTFEWLVETKRDGHVWVEVSLRQARIGGRDRVLGAIRDITDRKEHERRTQRLQRVTRDLMTAETEEEVTRIASTAAADAIDLPHCGVYLLGDAGDTLAASSISDGIEEFPSLTAFVSDATATAVDETVWRAFASGERAVVDDATDLHDSMGSMLVYPLGNHGVFVATSPETNAFTDADRSLLDILTANATAALDRADRETALRDREAELARQNERLEDFASIVSHDLRDPLEAAYGHLELAAMEADTDHHDGLREMLHRMEDIIEDALTLARHGQAVVEPEEVELGEVVDMAWDTAGSPEATLRTRGNLGTILGDRTRISQLLENLFRNAVEHAGPDVTVTVAGFADGFYVEDDGPGIPKDRRDEVFEVGYSTGDRGAGLGLSIVKQIAEAHGWEVTASSGSDGGARFDVTGIERV